MTTAPKTLPNSVFNQICTLIPDLQGWCDEEKACEIAAFILSTKPSVTVGIGVWGGRVEIAAALAHKHNGSGVVWAIDPWNAPESAKGMDGVNKEWWAARDHEAIYRGFVDNVNILELREYVNVLRQPSDAVKPPQEIGLLSVDGNHGEQSVRDVRRYAKNVRVGGIVVMDDINWEGGHVAKAAELLVSMGFVHLFPRGTGAFFQRIAKK